MTGSFDEQPEIRKPTGKHKNRFKFCFILFLTIVLVSTISIPATQAALPEENQATGLAADMIVVWADDQDSNLKYQILGRGLNSFGSQRFADREMNEIASGQQVRPDVAMWSDGGLGSVVVWEDDADENGLYQLKGRTFAPSGTEAGANFTINEIAAGQQLRPVVATAGFQTYFVAWQDDSNEDGKYVIRARGFKGAAGAEFISQFDVSSASGRHFNPRIASRSNGDFVIVWQDDADENGFYEIKARGFDSTGAERFGEITVNTASSGQQIHPDIGMADDGSFVVTWQDDADQNEYYQILARGFNSDGTQKFSTKTVNSTADGQQLNPKIGVASNGNFVVTWEDDADDNGYYQILARGFHPNGRQRFHDVTVNSFFEGQQFDPAIAMRNDGEFVISWEDDADGNGIYQIKARGFAINGSERFADITVNSVASGQQRLPAIAVNPAPAARTIDIVIGMHREVPSDEQAHFENIFGYLADGIYEMSNGAHKIGQVKVLNYDLGDGICDPRSDLRINPCHVIWRESEWPRASIAGYGHKSKRVYMGDSFPFVDSDGEPDPYDALATSNAKAVGYTFAHELGHYYYGLFDEYDVEDGDTEVPFSVMNNQWKAARGNSLLWLNFSTDKNFNQNNAQGRAYGASGWTTLMRPQSQDPRNGDRSDLPRRPFFPELVNVGPVGNDDPTFEIDTGVSQARSELDVVWSSSFRASVSDLSRAADPFNGLIESYPSQNVSYPEPVIITAEVGDRRNITRLDLSVQVTAPTTGSQNLMLKDDGVSPDREAEDGIYTGYMPYLENGEHQITADFSNDSGTAVFTSLNTFHTDSPSGGKYVESFDPVGENFEVTTTTSIYINNYAADDHSDEVADATTLLPNNSDVTGQISKAGDLDLFEVTASESGQMILRISDLAFGMAPSIQLKSMTGVVTSIPELTQTSRGYFVATFDVEADESLIVELSHTDKLADSGAYSISLGPALNGELASSDISIFLPLVVR